jgi:hypothetical protein
MKHHQIRPALRCCALVLPLLCAQNVLAKAQTVAGECDAGSP